MCNRVSSAAPVFVLSNGCQSCGKIPQSTRVGGTELWVGVTLQGLQQLGLTDLYTSHSHVVSVNYLIPFGLISLLYFFFCVCVGAANIFLLEKRLFSHYKLPKPSSAYHFSCSRNWEWRFGLMDWSIVLHVL